jgi:hypothetical protein
MYKCREYNKILLFVSSDMCPPGSRGNFTSGGSHSSTQPNPAQLNPSMEICNLEKQPILLPHILFGFCYVIFNSHMFNAPRFNSEKDVSLKLLLLYMRPIHVWRSRTPDGVRCAHFPSVITTIMDQKVQFINPLNLGELYAALHGRTRI